MGSAVEQELLGLLPWAESVPQAIEKAKQERKLILACIRSEFDSRKTIFFEQILLAAVLTDPDILHLVRQRFVPVRVNCPPFAYTVSDAGRAVGTDPVAPLGISLKDAKATALVASDAGRTLASITNMGTFDRDRILRFLPGALAKTAPLQSEVDPWKLG